MARRELFLLVAAVAGLATYLVASLSPAVEPPATPGVDCGLHGLPACWQAPRTFHLFFVHVPSAWAGYLAFGIVLAASLAYLRTASPRWDKVAEASAELGVLFTTVALVTGSLWMRAELGSFWRWEDARLATTFVLWLAYLAYLAVRRGHLPRARARVAAAYGVAAFALAPISYVSADVLRTSLHISLTSTPSYMRGFNGPLLLSGVGVFTLLYVALLAARMRITALSELAAEWREELEARR